jgi:hypothetical protein
MKSNHVVYINLGYYLASEIFNMILGYNNKRIISKNERDKKIPYYCVRVRQYPRVLICRLRAITQGKIERL